MTTTTQILQENAIRTIATERAARQAQLDAAEVEARRGFAAVLQAALVPVDDATDAQRAVLALVAATITVDDGYPVVQIPNETSVIVQAARKAGVFGPLVSSAPTPLGSLRRYYDGSAFCSDGTTGDARQATVDAYEAAKNYRASGK